MSTRMDGMDVPVSETKKLFDAQKRIKELEEEVKVLRDFIKQWLGPSEERKPLVARYQENAGHET